MKTALRTLLGAGLFLLAIVGTTHSAAAQTAQDPPILFRGPVEVQTSVRPPRYTTVQHILSMDADGNVSQLTLGSMGATRPSWSPDYRYIAFIRDGMLMVMEAMGEPNGARVFEVCPAWANGHDWHPDGSSIVFCGSHDIGPGLWEVYVDPTEEEVGELQLLREGTFFGDPSWSPDGFRIAFNDQGKVTILDVLDGTEMTTSRPCVSPSWSPVGDKLACARVVTDTFTKGKKSTTENFYEICVFDFDEGAWTRVTHLQSNTGYPAWSPDGTQLVFRSDVDDKLGTSLYGITIGSDEVTLLYAGGTFPNWAP